MMNSKHQRMIGAKTAAVLLAAALCIAATANMTFSQGENGRVKGYEKTDLEMFKAFPMDSNYYSEEWFHEFQFNDKEIIVIVSFMLNNIGLRKRSCDTYITVSDKTSGRIMDKIAVGPDEVIIDQEGFGITAADNRIELKDDKYHIRYRGKSVQADLVCKILAPSFSQGPGMVTFKDGSDFIKSNYPIPYAEASGTITYNNKTVKVSGHGHLSHDTQVLPPQRFPSRFRTLWLYTDEFAVGMVRLSALKFDGVWVQRLMVAGRGRILFTSHDYTIEELKPIKLEGAVIELPSVIRIEAVHGDDWLKGEYRISRVQESWGILDDYSPIFKKLAGYIVEDAWSFRYRVECDLQYHHDGKTETLKGKAVALYIEPIYSNKK